MDSLTEVYLFTENATAIFGENISLLLIGVAALLFSRSLFQQAKRESSKPAAKFTASFVLFWALLWISVSGCALAIRSNEYLQLVRIYKNQTYSIAEGTVKVIHQQAAAGHDQGDIILVDGTTFEFSYYAQSFHYHQTIHQGGMLNDGVYARLTYYTKPSAFEINPIIRVEVLASKRQ